MGSMTVNSGYMRGDTDTYTKAMDGQPLEDCVRSTQSASPSEDGPPLPPLSLPTSLQGRKREQGRAVEESLHLRLDTLALLHLPRAESLCTRGARVCTPRPSTRTSIGSTSAGMGRERRRMTPSTVQRAANTRSDARRPSRGVRLVPGGEPF